MPGDVSNQEGSGQGKAEVLRKPLPDERKAGPFARQEAEAKGAAFVRQVLKDIRAQAQTSDVLQSRLQAGGELEARTGEGPTEQRELFDAPMRRYGRTPCSIVGCLWRAAPGGLCDNHRNQLRRTLARNGCECIRDASGHCRRHYKMKAFPDFALSELHVHRLAEYADGRGLTSSEAAAEIVSRFLMLRIEYNNSAGDAVVLENLAWARPLSEMEG